MILFDLAKTVVEGVVDTVKGNREAKKAISDKELEIKLKALDHRAKMQLADQSATTNYDIEALKASGSTWKDEYLTILLSLPVIGSFVPIVQDYVVVGWGYIEKAPLWFQTSFIGVIAATFGLRWLFSRQKNIV